ncbi:MAG: DUF2785 domain-containing protein [Bacteriovoracaceae bacterium]|nr:DUF2785 domain-containing protein [Bacteriovoracaceae bacterium]
MKNLSNLSYRELLQYMEVLGDPDPVARDEVGFSNIDEYLYSDKFPKEWSINLIRDLFTPNFVFSDILVKRSFSLLVVAAAVCADEEYCSVDLKYVLAQLKRYLDFETMWIGSCEEVGIVHNLAHLSDAMGSITTHPSSTVELREEISLLVKAALQKTKSITFVDGELERLDKVSQAIAYMNNL